MDQESMQRLDKAVHEATELLLRAEDILRCLIETEIPELIIRTEKS